MHPIISFEGLENRVITAKYGNLMVKAKIVLFDKINGEQLADPVTMISSPAPSGTLRIILPASVKPGTYCLRALNGHGEFAAQSVDFTVSGLR